MYTGRKRRFYEIYRKRTVTVNEKTRLPERSGSSF